MKRQKSILLAIAGISLLAVSQTQAQVTYTAGDLLLNIRDTLNPTGNDLEVDLGSASTFAAQTGPTIEVASPTLVNGANGAQSGSVDIGFSASGGLASSDTLWLTRYDDTPGFSPADPVNGDSVESGQQAASAQGQTITRINLIGAGAQAGTSDGAHAALVVGATSGDSYQAQGEHSTTLSGQAVIDFGTTQGTGANVGGVIENSLDTQSAINDTGDYNGNTSSTIYEALWTVPPGSSGSTSDTYDGYFSLLPTGEIDYTPAVSSIPEPSTYVLLGMTGVLGFVFRRQIRSLVA
jgi:hypothetical protein